MIINPFISVKNLEKEVRDYVSKNKYDGFTKPFELEKLELPDREDPASINPNAVYTILKGNFDEDLGETNGKWEKGLFEIGKKYCVELHLPYWYYEK